MSEISTIVEQFHPGISRAIKEQDADYEATRRQEAVHEATIALYRSDPEAEPETPLDIYLDQAEAVVDALAAYWGVF